jgi:hypothetical protein
MTLEHFAWFAAGFGAGTFALAIAVLVAVLRHARATRAT